MAIKDGLGDLMKQAQEMQGKVQKMQEEVANLEVTGESGAGMVKVVMNGRHDVKRVEIDQDLMQEKNQEGKEVLEDLIAAAVNDAVRRVEEAQKDKMSDITSGIPLPPGFKFPFQ